MCEIATIERFENSSSAKISIREVFISKVMQIVKIIVHPRFIQSFATFVIKFFPFIIAEWTQNPEPLPE